VAIDCRSARRRHRIELDAGSWVIFQIPGFTKAASGIEQNNLDDLRKADVTSYYKASDALWVKLVSPGRRRPGWPPRRCDRQGQP
jgi:hypothetical protein